jgi:hypothetical protein
VKEVDRPGQGTSTGSFAGQHDATAPAPIPLYAHQAPSVMKPIRASGGQEGDDDGQGPGVTKEPGMGGAEWGIRAGGADPDEDGTTSDHLPAWAAGPVTGWRSVIW